MASRTRHHWIAFTDGPLAGERTTQSPVPGSNTMIVCVPSATPGYRDRHEYRVSGSSATFVRSLGSERVDGPASFGERPGPIPPP